MGLTGTFILMGNKAGEMGRAQAGRNVDVLLNNDIRGG